jgi:hypothetical protein
MPERRDWCCDGAQQQREQPQAERRKEVLALIEKENGPACDE